MKAHVIGIEISEGVSKKTGKPYAIGKLYAALPIVGDGARGLMGSMYQCEPAVLRNTTSSCVVVSPARSSVFSHPASSVTASSSHSVRRIICRYGVSGC